MKTTYQIWRCMAFLAGILYLSPLLATQPQLHLVFDKSDVEAKIAKKYRACPDIRASASGQFSADELAKILRVIPDDRRAIWIVDLRQESHGFIDGLPVSWISDRNAGNIDKNPAQILLEEQSLLRAVKTQKTVTVYTLKKYDHGKVTVADPAIMLPETVETEHELVKSLNAKYARIYVLDHNKPDDLEVDNFVRFIKHKVKDGDWLHFHCRGGSGRSSTFITMYDMIRNAHSTSFAQIIQRQTAAGSIKFDAMPTEKNKLWKADSAQERYAFLRKFYAYVQDPNGYRARSWSAWQQL